MLKLVYGCLAFSLVACVIIFVAAAQSGEGFHGMTKSMGDAIAGGATVLDADRNGAITQTGNGRVVGYERSGDQAWSTKFNRFKEGPSNPYGAGANDASAWCMTGCPSALVAVEGSYEAFGGASQGLAGELNTIAPKPEDIMALSGKDAAFVRVPPPDGSSPQLIVYAPNKLSMLLVGLTPSEVQPARPKRRAVVGSAKGRVGALGKVEKLSNGWQTTDRSITEVGLKNVCVSDDEQWIGAVSNRVNRFAFNAKPGASLGPALTGGRCTVDKQGITAIYTPKANPETVVAARYSASGRAVWVHQFGAQRLLSPAGSPIVVTQAADGNVTAIDALTGRDVYRGKLNGIPFVGGDGSIVTADRRGEPEWVLVGKSGSPQ